MCFMRIKLGQILGTMMSKAVRKILVENGHAITAFIGMTATIADILIEI
jgi:hypothetical protein